MSEEYLKEDGYFRVIKIVSNSEIIINGGTMDGLNENDDINIIVPGDIITDPYDYDKKLGSLDFIKDTLTIKTITPYYSICHKVKLDLTSSSAFLTPTLIAKTLASYGNTPDSVEVPLDIIESEISNGYPESTESRIVIGDYARKRY